MGGKIVQTQDESGGTCNDLRDALRISNIFKTPFKRSSEKMILETFSLHSIQITIFDYYFLLLLLRLREYSHSHS